MAAIAVRKLSKSFGPTPVLRDVTLDVPAGGFCVLVGPSGCGKSTLLRCIAGLELPDGGSVHIGERDVTRLEPRDRDVAMVFQSYALYPHLTVEQNLAFGLKLRKVSPDEIGKRVQEASALLGLDPLLARFPRQLSGGQRQRVAMGRAIVRNPQLFLFDEPLSNLDAALRSQVRVDVRRLHDRLKATSVYVTHDQVEAMTLADVMVVLNKGLIEQAGAPLDVYRRPATRFVAGFLGSPSMSFLRGKVEGAAGAAEVRIGDAWRLDPGPEFDLPAGREVEVGLRPEDVELDEASGWRAKVDVVEALGSETFAHLEGPGGRLVARLSGEARVRAGETVGVRALPGRAHLFDAASGRSCRRAGAA
ncbi:MAG TPA: sn-glycerol-3-phosphate ABC transporter ATP-binding protein UgpC [Polyangiaceae bacterium]|nr:sn-glycerol-3-phosphate ABC transporter ATP-binding protein UgpC [Polyangiaceae bacterium]